MRKLYADHWTYPVKELIYTRTTVSFITTTHKKTNNNNKKCQMKRRTKKEKLKEKEIKRIQECDKMQQNKVFITRNKAENDTRKVEKKLRRTNRTRPLDDLRKEKKSN